MSGATRVIFDTGNVVEFKEFPSAKRYIEHLKRRRPRCTVIEDESGDYFVFDIAPQ